MKIRARVRSKHLTGYIRPQQNWHRDLLLLVLAGLWVVTAIQLHSAVSGIEQNRKFTAVLSCSFGNSVAEAGRLALTGKLTPMTSASKKQNDQFIKHLEKFGYRPPSKAQQEQAARVYSEKISSTLNAQTKGQGSKLLNPDGTLNCKAYANLIRHSKI